MSDQEEIQESTRKRKYENDEDENGDEEDDDENNDTVQMKANKDEKETNEKKNEESVNNNNDDDDDDEKKSNEDEQEKNNLDRSFDISSSEDEDDEEEEAGDFDENFDIFEALNKTEPSTTTETNNAMLMMSKMNRDDFDEAAQLLDFDKSDEFDDIKSFKKIKATGGEEKSESEEKNEDTTENKKGKDASISKDQSSLTSSEKQRLKKQVADNTAKELARRKKLEQMEEESKKMQVLIANFSEEQLNRYEIFRRSAFPKSSIKKIIQTVCGKTVSASVVIAMSGIAKVFVGEIVEKALDVKQKWNENGPLQPKHLRESFRVYKNNNKILTSNRAKRPSMFI
jgi:transcription initiation factor TFIID subunit 11